MIIYSEDWNIFLSKPVFFPDILTPGVISTGDTGQSIATALRCVVGDIVLSCPEEFPDVLLGTLFGQLPKTTSFFF